jgi:Family of unknown function (DUF5695)
VRKSLFYYSPQDAPDFNFDPSLNWTTWTSLKRVDAESIGRGYSYPHVIAAYWSMYRLARNHQGLVTNHSWEWYLDQAYETARFMFGRQENGRRRASVAFHSFPSTLKWDPYSGDYGPNFFGHAFNVLFERIALRRLLDFGSLGLMCHEEIFLRSTTTIDLATKRHKNTK